MKSKVYYVQLILLSLFIFSCTDKGPSPKNVLSQYLDAKFKLEFERAYELVSQEDKSIKSFQEYLDENKNNALPITRVFTDKSSFEIIEIEIDNAKAMALVELTIPDGEKIAGELMGTLFSKMFDKDFDEEKLATSIQEKYKGKEIPMTTETDTLNLVKDEDGWKVYLNWKLEAILSEAEKLKEEKKLYGAIEKYEQILALDSKMVDAIEGLEETQNELKIFEEKQDYIDKISLYELSARYYNTYSDDKVPGVTFKLKNNGNRTLTKVEVTVYFKDENGTIIFEEDYNPVLVSEYSFGENKPLKPNYVWSMGKDKFYKAESVPSEWKTGNVSAKITDIKFK